jgi:predicted secreted protein
MKGFGLFSFFDVFKKLISGLFQFAINDGSDVWVKVAGTLVNGLTTKTIDMATDEIDVTTQDSGKYKEFLAGFKSGTLSFDFKDDESDAHAYDELFAAWVAGVAVAFVYGKGIKTTGGRTITGSAIITGLTLSDPMNAESGGSCKLRITGTPALATSTTTVA